MKYIYTLLTVVVLLCTACDDKLDIKPLGKTTLDTVDDLETLLNQLPRLTQDDNFNDFEILCNNSYVKWKSMAECISNPNSILYALFTCDETVDRADLTSSSQRYTKLYSNINYMNVVISKMPEATGDPGKKAQLIAEARVLRAWYHFLLVNMYARQYDAATADDMGGIPYVDNTNVGEEKTKRTLAEVYERLLNDCSDDVLKDLIQSNVSDPCRFGVDFGYGVRARVLFQMKRYDEALKYANLALGINGRIEDRSGIQNTGEWILTETATNNYYLMYSDNSNLGDYYGMCVPAEVARLISPDDYILKYAQSAWEEPYATLPQGALQCGISDIKFNVWGIRAETMYYLAAECLIRRGDIKNGLAQMDRVRAMRIDNYTPLAGQAGELTEKQAMKLLQEAKRVEFLNTFDNFCDRKRWNSEPAYAETLTHDLGTYGTYSLAPDSPLWVFPFPQDAVNHNQSLTQNY